MTSARALLACLALATTEANAEPVDVELVLAVDVSESMDRDEFAVQRAGYVRACVILPSLGQRFPSQAVG